MACRRCGCLSSADLGVSDGVAQLGPDGLLLAAQRPEPHTFAGQHVGPASYAQATGIQIDLTAEFASIDYGRIDTNFDPGNGFPVIDIYTIVNSPAPGWLTAHWYGNGGDVLNSGSVEGLDMRGLAFHYIAVGEAA